MELSNTSQVVQTIKEAINNAKLNVAEVELLAESLSKTADSVAEQLTVEDFNNLQTIIEKVQINNVECFK